VKFERIEYSVAFVVENQLRPFVPRPDLGHSLTDDQRSERVEQPRRTKRFDPLTLER
jgi:hypothetical protein